MTNNIYIHISPELSIVNGESELVDVIDRQIMPRSAALLDDVHVYIHKQYETIVRKLKNSKNIEFTYTDFIPNYRKHIPEFFVKYPKNNFNHVFIYKQFGRVPYDFGTFAFIELNRIVAESSVQLFYEKLPSIERFVDIGVRKRWIKHVFQRSNGNELSSELKIKEKYAGDIKQMLINTGIAIKYGREYKIADDYLGIFNSLKRKRKFEILEES